MAAAAGLLGTCILPSEPSTPLGRIQFLLPADTLLLAIAGEISPAIQVRAEGKALPAPRLRFESGDSSRVVVDESGKIIARKRGPAPIRVTLVSGAVGEAPPETTLTIQVIVGSMRLARADTSLSALGDTVWFRPGYLDAGGASLSLTDSAAINPRYQIVSAGGAGRAVALDTATGTIVARANGADTVRAAVDTSSVLLAVTVRQRATRVSVIPNSTQLRSLTETRQFSVTAWDRRDSLIAQPAAAWTSSAPGVMSIDAASGLATAAANGAAQITATVDGVAASATATVAQVPKQLGFVVQPSGTPAATPITPAVRVAVQDSLGSTVAGATSSIAIAIGTNPSGGTLAGTTPRDAVNGVATFADLSINKLGTGYTLTAAAGSLASATSAAFDIRLGAASKLIFSAQPITTQAGSVIPAVQVTAQDVAGNTDTTYTGNVTLAIGTNPGGDTLSGTKTMAAVKGIATFSSLTIAKSGSGYTLTAAGSGLTGTTSVAFDVTVGPPAKLGFTVQPPGSIAAGSALSVDVAVQDAFGNTVTSATNTIAVAVTSSDSLFGTTAVAAVNGVARFSDLSMHKAGSGYTLSATSGSLTSATSTPFAVTHGAATQLVFTQQPSPTVAGSLISPPVQVTVEDSLGNTVTTGLAATTLVTVALGSNPTGGTLVGTLARSAVNGIATFSDLSIAKAGSGYSLTASATGLAGAGSAGFDITAGPATKLAFAAQPSNTQAGSVISPAVQVAAQDAFGNTITTFTGNVSVTLSGAGLSGTPTVPAVAGVATFADLSIDKSGTGYTLSTSGGGFVATSTAFNIAPGAPSKLAFTAQPSTTAAGAAIAPVQVTVQDALGNTVTSATSSITLAITGGTGSPGAMLSGTATIPAAGGVATFSTLSINKAGTGYSLTASATGVAGATSAVFDITPGAASRLVFTVQPPAATAGTALAPAVQVTIQDALGNAVTTAGSSITLAITPGSGTSGAVLSGTTTKPAAGGTASFSDLSINKAGTSYTLAAAATGLTGAVSSAFDITPGPATKIVFTVQPSTAQAGATLSPDIRVVAQDALGNTATGFGANLTVAIKSPSPDPTAVLNGTKTLPAVGGVTTFSDLSIDKAASGYRLTATSGSFSDTSSAFSITAGPPSKLAFLVEVEPSTTQAGTIISPAVQVAFQDGSGNTLTGLTDNITLAITTGPGGATLTGTRTVAAVNGVATFSDLSIDKAGAGYSLTASASGFAGSTSAVFSVNPGAPARLAFTVQPVSTVAGGTITPGVRVAVQDALGNVVTTSSQSVTLAITTGTGSSGATLGGTATVAAASGIALFSDLNIAKAGAAYTLTATGGSLTAAASAAFNIAPGAATQLVVTGQPTTTRAGNTIAPAVQVTARDAHGNTDTLFSAAISLAITSGTGTAGAVLGGTTSLSAVKGIATFPGLSIDKAGVNYTLTATGGGLPASAPSSAFNITGTRLVFTVEPPATTEAGAPMAPAITVAVQDAFGNTDVAYTGSIALIAVAVTSGDSLFGTATVAALNGVATFSDLSMHKVGTGYRLVASATGLSDDTSATFAITPAAAAHLKFTVQPSTAERNTVITPPIQVTAFDAYGNLATGYTGAVTVDKASGPSAGKVNGTKTKAAVAGVAVFDDLTVTRTNPVYNPYTLSAAAAGLAGDTSVPFNITS